MSKLKSYEEQARQFEEARKIKSRKYQKDEDEFQEAQAHFERYQDLKSWGVMYIKIQKACFNRLNKKLVGKAPNETIEAYSHDITINIMNCLKRKIATGQFWKIGKLSAFVYLPCLAIYDKQTQFEDKILMSDAYTLTDTDGREASRETEESYFCNGILYLWKNYEKTMKKPHIWTRTPLESTQNKK